MLPVFACGFECGALGTAGQHWSTGGTAPTINTGTVRSGARSLRTNCAAGGSSSASHTIAAGIRTVVLRGYVRFTTLPSNGTVALFGTANAAFDGAIYNAADGKVYATAASGAGVSVTTGQFYRVDVRVDTSANPHLCDVQIDGTPTSQGSFATAAADAGTVALGAFAAVGAGGFDAHWDDVVVSATLADYPIGPGFVSAHSPNRDGTHTGTGTNFAKGAAGTAITVTSTDIWGLLDDVPLAFNTSDYVNQVTSSPTQYVEVGFASATGLGDGPRGVEILIAAGKGSTAFGNMTFKWNDNGTTVSVWAFGSSAIGSSGVVFNSTHYASLPTGGAWTKARFDALRMRGGYSTDATPDVFWHAVMIEAEFVQGGATQLITSMLTGLGSIGGNLNLSIPVVGTMVGQG
jgi:hypothetical protein